MQSPQPGISRRLLHVTVVILAAAGLAGCSSLAFYGQAVLGQLEVLHKRQRIETVLNHGASSAELRRKLELVLSAREFAVSELQLPDNDSYRSYADLQRPYALWNVFAAPELSLTPVEACYLFFGCISYRSYFSQAAALRHADSLRASGHDVYVAGVAAYSTAGWFDDPVLNTMLESGDAWIVKVMFHELAHQLLHVRNDTVFNESFATMVAEEGFARWIRVHGPAEGDGRVARDRHDALIDLMLRHRTHLEQIYASKRSDAAKRELKAATFAGLRDAYQELKRAWSGYAGYDEWMATDLNNAKLASVATYHDYVPAFEAILKLTDNDIERFYAEARRVSRLRRTERDECLRALMRDAGKEVPPCIDRPDPERTPSWD